MKVQIKFFKRKAALFFSIGLLFISSVACHSGHVPEIEVTVSTVSEGKFYDGLETDSHGNLYGSDFVGDAVYKLNTEGEVSVFADGLNSPNGIGINSKDEVYVCDHFGNAIFKYNKQGELMTSFEAISPAGIKKMPRSDDMLFVEYNTNTINLLKEDGTIVKLFEGAPINGPAGIAFDRKGKAYIGNFNDLTIYSYENGEVQYVAQLPAEAANFNFLGFLTYAKGYLYATQLGEHRIYKINPNKIDSFEVFAGSALGNTDGDISEATFNFPNGIVASRDQKTLYISDAGTSNLRIITSQIRY